MAIIQLDKKTIEQIAAGEVIESPFSIVKELVENSIDANSKNITVEIKNGGKTYIRVTDDGSGINEDEIELAFKRHATSKIKDFSDLYKLFTLGFRGEALASIITCSDLTIISKTENQSIGKKLIYKNAHLDSKSSIATNTGTSIEVFDLFKNQPVRRKFLKSDMAETNKINKLMYAIAISNKDLSIKYIRDNKIDFQTNREDLSTIICKLLDENLKDNLISVSFANDIYKINGYISKSTYYRGNRSLQYLFVNNRYVYNEALTKCIEREYKSLIPNGRFPAFFIFVETDGKNIDVNMHPNKKEIKFVYEDILLDLLSNNISKILYENKTIKSVINKEEEKKELNFYDDYQKVIDSYNKLVAEDESLYSEDNDKQKEEKDFFEEYDKADFSSDDLEEEISFINTPEINLNDKYNSTDNANTDNSYLDLDKLSYKASIFGRYSIYESKDKLIILDHRRADLAIHFERFIEDFENKRVSSQKLLDPLIISLDSNSYNSYLKKEELFKNLGFEIERFGQRKLIIRYVPIIFENPENLDYFYQLLDVDYKSDKESLYRKIYKIISKQAFKKGYKIDKEEADYLIKNLKKLKNPYKNYQGQNTMIKIEKNELETYFDR
ncbi:MAG: DNA mismatch repair endonuclease MutL [Peptoniphilaceae bacterium]|nr:DNA mismatch repair endonuclease MutL [Peptoniphilaceae bacterium]MDY6019614.1 DNA mismatch repair endonuclease MutL [Anaerococcus sp.]